MWEWRKTEMSKYMSYNNFFPFMNDQLILKFKVYDSWHQQWIAKLYMQNKISLS